MPGLKVVLTVNEPSLNGGRKARGRFQAAMPAAHDRDSHRGDEHPLVPEGDPEQAGVAALEPAQKGAVVLGEAFETR